MSEQFALIYLGIVCFGMGMACGFAIGRRQK